MGPKKEFTITKRVYSQTPGQATAGIIEVLKRDMEVIFYNDRKMIQVIIENYGWTMLKIIKKETPVGSYKTLQQVFIVPKDGLDYAGLIGGGACDKYGKDIEEGKNFMIRQTMTAHGQRGVELMIERILGFKPTLKQWKFGDPRVRFVPFFLGVKEKTEETGLGLWLEEYKQSQVKGGLHE